MNVSDFRTHSGLALLILIPCLTGCDHRHSEPKDTSTFNRRIACSQLSYGGKWENLPDGPFLDGTFYSPSLDTCVFVMRRAHRGEKAGDIHHEVAIIDALSRKQLWANDPEAGETEDQVTAKLNQQLKSLQITP